MGIEEFHEDVMDLMVDSKKSRGLNEEAVTPPPSPPKASKSKGKKIKVEVKVEPAGDQSDTLAAKVNAMTADMGKKAVPMPTPEKKIMEREWALIRKPDDIHGSMPGWAIPEMDYLDGLVVEKSALVMDGPWMKIKKKKQDGFSSATWLLHPNWCTPVYIGAAKGGIFASGLSPVLFIGKWVEARARKKPRQRYLRGEYKGNVDAYWCDLNSLSPDLPAETLGMSVEEWREAYWQVISAAVKAGEIPTTIWEENNGTHCTECGCDKDSECGVGCFCCCNPEKMDAVGWVRSGELSANKIAALIKYAAGKGGDGHEGKLGVAGYLTKGMATVYALQHCAYLQVGDQPAVIKALDNTVQELSTRMYNYIGMACLGEARHMGSLKGDGSVLAKGIAGVKGQVGRMESWHAFDLLAEVLDGGERQLLEHLVGIFNSGEWRGGYGGYKWGAVAEVALAFKKGEISAMLFIDTIANMVHNGGWVFNKWYTQSIDCCTTHRARERYISHILDAKAQDARKLAGIICLPEPAKSGLMHRTVADEEAVGSLLEKLSVIRRGR